MAAPKRVSLSKLKGPARQARVAQMASKPGTRSLLSDKDLPAQYKALREKNRYLSAPVTQGSQMTNRDLAHQRQAAETLQFGPDAIGKAQTFETQTVPAYYQAYRDALAKAQEQTRTAGEQAQSNIVSLLNAGAGTPMKEGMSDANQQVYAQAQGVSQDRLRSIGAMLAGQSGAATGYANQLTNVVAPLQQLEGQMKAHKGTEDLRSKVGAWRSQFNSQAVSDEARSVLAKAALSQKAADALFDQKSAAARLSETSRHNQAVERTAAQRAAAAAVRAASGSGGKKPSGPPRLPPGQAGAGLSQLAVLKSYAEKARDGLPFVDGHSRQPRLTAEKARLKVQGATSKLKHPALLDAAVDAAYLGYLSAETVRKINAAGYRPSEVAQTLGVETAGQRTGKSVTNAAKNVMQSASKVFA